MATRRRKAEARKVCWDSNAFISLIEETQDRIAALRAVFEEGVQKDIVLIASSICITEVAFTAAERGGPSRETERKIAKLWLPGSPVQIAEYTTLVARQAQKLLRIKCETGLSLKALDAIHIATAMQAKAAELHTYDVKLYAWSEHSGVSIKAPDPHQMLLHGQIDDDKTEAD